MTISEKIKQNGIKTAASLAKLIVGKKAKCLSNSSGSGISIGAEVEIIGVNGGPTNYQITTRSKSTGVSNGWASPHELDLVSASTIQELTEENDQLAKDLAQKKDLLLRNEAKIAFMKRNKLESFDECEFKVYETLELLESKKLSKIEKAKAVAKLINS